MSSGSSTPEDNPDFSFLGDQSVPDLSEVPEFEDVPPNQSDVPVFDEMGAPPDSSTSDAADPVPDINVEPENTPQPAVAPVPAPKARSTKRLKPKTARSAEAPTEDAAIEPAVKQQLPPKAEATQTGVESAAGEPDQFSALNTDSPSPKTVLYLAVYATALTLAFLGLLLAGRISLFGRNVLESLPDVEPLRKNEFQLVPPDAELPAGHALNLGESQRFGDIVLKPLKVTQEQLTFVNMMNGSVADGKVSKPILKLWFQITNASPDIAFPPWDVALMSHRSEKNETTIANSWLMVKDSTAETDTQVLNFFHSPDSNLDIADQHSRQLLNPGQQMTSFIACSDEISMIAAEKIESYRWRIQIRKGVHVESGHGVTTLVDVNFSPDDIES